MSSDKPDPPKEKQEGNNSSSEESDELPQDFSRPSCSYLPQHVFIFIFYSIIYF